MGYPGFDIRTSNDVCWKVYHNQGIDYVYATSEALAIARYSAKYPKRVIRKVERA